MLPATIPIIRLTRMVAMAVTLEWSHHVPGCPMHDNSLGWDWEYVMGILLCCLPLGADPVNLVLLDACGYGSDPVVFVLLASMNATEIFSEYLQACSVSCMRLFCVGLGIAEGFLDAPHSVVNKVAVRLPEDSGNRPRSRSSTATKSCLQQKVHWSC